MMMVVWLQEPLDKLILHNLISIKMLNYANQNESSLVASSFVWHVAYAVTLQKLHFNRSNRGDTLIAAAVLKWENWIYNNI